MFTDSPREMYELLKEICGPRFAKLGFWVIVLGAMAVGLLAIGTLILKVNSVFVSPYVIPVIRGVHVPSISSALSGVLVSSAMTAIAIFAVALYGRKWYRREQEWESDFLDKFFRQNVFPRIERIEENVPSLSSARDRAEAIEQRIRQLEIRCPDPSRKPPTTHLDGLVSALTMSYEDFPEIQKLGEPE